MVPTPPARNCLACNKEVKGRTDKKFCNDYCRNYYNNQLKSAGNSRLRQINNALGKNRRILARMLDGGDEILRVQKEQLLQEGFVFRYMTHTFTNAKGNTYIFCYDYGYLQLVNDCVLVVKEI